jgi:hypothetical protein
VIGKLIGAGIICALSIPAFAQLPLLAPNPPLTSQDSLSETNSRILLDP